MNRVNHTALQEEIVVHIRFESLGEWLILAEEAHNDSRPFSVA